MDESICGCLLSENVAAPSLQDTDLVPSDVAAGLTLLHQEQDKVENCPKEPEEVLTQSPLSPVVSQPGLPKSHWLRESSANQ